MQPAFLANHARRTYLWGALLAQRDALDHDEELLYVASLLHDTGLDPERTDGLCFTLASGRIAEKHGREAGWPPERGESAAEAITLHLNPRVGTDHGVEAHLLAAGAHLDVIGRRFYAIDRDARDRVLAQHPRQGFKKRFSGLWRDVSRETPGSPARTLQRMGFGLAIRLTPFGD